MANSLDKDAVFDLFGKHVSPGKAKFFKDVGLDFAFGKREGPFVWDLDGEKRLINCHSNGGVFNLGHRHPEIIEAVRAAMEEVDIGNHHFVSEARARLASRLADSAPGDLPYCIFGVSGGEAVDAAIKIARGATRRKRILSVSGGYHGHTGLALAAGDEKFSKPFLGQSEDFRQIPFNDLAALEEALDDSTAAFLLEPIPATLGMPMPNADYLPEAQRLCESNGSVFIADEVQTGLGRTGDLWACETYGVQPDILVTGKGLSGGIYPIAATLISERMMKVFEHDPFAHISTFGGSEIGCAAAERTLEISGAPEFLANVRAMGQRLEAGLDRLAGSYSEIFVAPRCKAMFAGLEMANEMLGPLMSRFTYDAGLLCVYAGNDSRIVQFLPPLIADAALVDEILQRLEKALEAARVFLKSATGS